VESVLPQYDRRGFPSGPPFGVIGRGEIGGKASGLVAMWETLRRGFPSGEKGPITVDTPPFVVIATGVFDAFLDRNGLRETALSDLDDQRLAHFFLQAELPTEIIGDLRAISEGTRTPLAVRSSSLLEDALRHPFAGVYATKMTPNNAPDPGERFRKLVEAVKLVYASTFFRHPKEYARAAGRSIRDEKMAVIVQEVVGREYSGRFYPTLSGVCRSFDFYSIGGAKPEDGVVELALGLGKTIVDGGIAYMYSPGRPLAPPPFGSVGEMMKRTQRTFWAINVGPPPPYNPSEEAGYLIQQGLEAADYDGALPFVASTYLPGSDRLSPGTGAEGPRVINFAPLLQLEELPLNSTIRRLLKACEEESGGEVEIEFAMTLPRKREPLAARLGFLQVRPMLVSREQVALTEEELGRSDLVLASHRAMGNGVQSSIRDVVYVKPEAFGTQHTRTIAAELNRVNASLVAEARAYLLIGFGRWGSADPFLGIPVRWGQISGARVIVEAALPALSAEPSQGSHFFHNVTAFQVSCLAVGDEDPEIDWDWLGGQAVVAETAFLRHVRLEAPLLVKVDGRTGRGAIWRTAEGTGDRP